MSVRDRLKSRAKPTAEHRMRIEDVTGPLAAVEAAESEWRLARLRDGEDSEAAQDTKARLDEARAALAACYETLHLEALAPVDIEELIAAHPPTKQQREEGAAWNIDTFRPALLAACVKGDMTEQDWADWTTKGPVSIGEVRSLWADVLGVNDRSTDSRIPKG